MWLKMYCSQLLGTFSNGSSKRSFLATADQYYSARLFSLGQPRRIAWPVGIKGAPLQNNQDVLCYALMGILTKKLLAEQPFQELKKGLKPSVLAILSSDTPHNCVCVCLHLHRKETNPMKLEAFPGTLWLTLSSENFYLPVEFCVSNWSGVYQATVMSSPILNCLIFYPTGSSAEGD